MPDDREGYRDQVHARGHQDPEDGTDLGLTPGAYTLELRGFLPRETAPFAVAFLAWGAATGAVALGLAASALERGHGPWVEALESPEEGALP